MLGSEMLDLQPLCLTEATLLRLGRVQDVLHTGAVPRRAGPTEVSDVEVAAETNKVEPERSREAIEEL